MSIERQRHRLVSRRDERGAALVIAMTLMLVMAALAAVILATGSSSERQSGRGKNWTQALHVAEAGAQEAIATLQAAQGSLPARDAACDAIGAPAVADLCNATTEGAYQVDVTYLGQSRYQIDATGSVGEAVGLRTERTIRVILAPPPMFRYALFSLTDVDTKNNDYVNGDIWANGSVIVEQNDVVEGNVTAATGWVRMRGGSRVTKNVQSGGHDGVVAVRVGTNSIVDGDVVASSTASNCADDPARVAYQVDVVGTVKGSVTTWGTKTGGGSTGPLFEGVCTEAPPTEPIPEFRYNPLNYDPTPFEFASPADFQSWLNSSGMKTQLTGTFYVQGTGAVDLSGVTITGDTTIIALNAAINANQVRSANNNEKRFILLSGHAPPPGSACTDGAGNTLDCAIGLTNGFTSENNVATLLWAPNGPCAFKNSADFSGAVYCNDIVLKNNLNVFYDTRVERVIGFGSTSLSQESWVETTAS